MWHVWQILYLGLWALLLIHCVRRKRFFPILGAGWSTKVFWLATFLFFNPVLTVLYLVFGVMLGPLSPERRHPIGRAVSIVAVTLVAVTVVFFEMPALGKADGPVKIVADEPTDTSALDFEASAGVLKASENFSTAAFSFDSENARLSAREIVILCADDHPLLDKVARLVGKQLSEQPYVQSVTYYPTSEAVETQQLLPDVFVTLAMPRIDEDRSPAGRTLNVHIECEVGRTLYPSHSSIAYRNSPPVINFGMETTLQHKSSFMGVESRQGRYKQQAESIAGQIAKSITGQFDKWKDEHGVMPELPGYLYGVSFGPPQLPFLQGDYARALISGGGLLFNNQTTWMFVDERPTRQVLEDCRQTLQELGWRGGRELDGEAERTIDSITMSKGDEHITILRRHRRHPETGGVLRGDAGDEARQAPMIAHYRSLFDADQMHAAMDRLLDSDTDLETILIFGRSIRSDDLRQRLLSRIEEDPVQSMRGWLTIADFYVDEQPEKAKQAFFRARALARAEKQHNPEPNRFKSLAKKLGDESLADADVDPKYYTEAGFIDLTGQTEPVSVEKRLNETAAFCAANASGKITTAVLKVQPAASVPECPEQPPQYELLEIIKTATSSGTGTSSYYSGKGSSHIQDFGEMTTKVETLADERFRFQAQFAEHGRAGSDNLSK